MQQKQLQEKSQHSTTEAKCAPVDIVEPKLTWMGMAQTTKPPEHQAASIATKSQRKPSVAAIASTHYGPSIPPSITGKPLMLVVTSGHLNNTLSLAIISRARPLLCSLKLLRSKVFVDFIYSF